MAKRFIDTELWDKEKFNQASLKLKTLTLFIFCKCDCIGIFKMSPTIINAYIGTKITTKDILSIPMDIVPLEDGSFWLPKFCDFQYGELSENCKPHKKYIKMLSEKGLPTCLSKGYSKGYAKGMDTLQEKEEEKEKETEKEEDKREDRLQIPPEREDVAAYIEENKYDIDPEVFMDFYASKAWKIGKNKMVDWKAAVRTWSRNSRGCGRAKLKDEGETKFVGFDGEAK